MSQIKLLNPESKEVKILWDKAYNYIKTLTQEDFYTKEEAIIQSYRRSIIFCEIFPD